MARVALPFGSKTPPDKKEWYRNALLAAGMEPVEDVRTLDGLGGLLLAGGTDVDPDLFGESRHPKTEEPDRARDELEAGLLREALAGDLPVLAICRGLQLFNVVLGGTLAQHIEGHDHRKLREAHEIEITPGSRLEAILGATRYVVNSRHHQGIGSVASGAEIAAKAVSDGVVEALELPERRFVLAVQWHPEARMDGPDAKLFHAFQAAVAGR